MTTIERTRVPGGSRSRTPSASRNPMLGPGNPWPRPTAGSSRQNQGASPGSTRLNQSASGAVDHWSAILFYSMGFGTIAVVLVLFLALAAVWMYGQFVWTFTHWDFADVPLESFQPAAEFVLLGVFACGFCVGLWCFSGQAWKKSRNSRSWVKPRTP